MNQLDNINEHELKELEDELIFQEKRVQEAREKLREKKRLEIQRQQEELRNKLTLVDQTIEENRKKRVLLRQELSNKQTDSGTTIRENMRVHQETWELEREHQLEEAARRRLELERARAQREIKVLVQYTNILVYTLIDYHDV